MLNIEKMEIGVNYFLKKIQSCCKNKVDDRTNFDRSAYSTGIFKEFSKMQSLIVSIRIFKLHKIIADYEFKYVINNVLTILLIDFDLIKSLFFFKLLTYRKLQAGVEEP